MINITIYYTRFTQKLPSILWEKYIGKLPKDLKERNSCFVRWQDRHSNLIGKLLLIEGLKLYKYTNDLLPNIEYNKYNRPFINGEVNFNISHSGEYVICVLGEGLRLGVDIEEINNIDYNDFKKVMSEKQWDEIYKSNDPTKEFFKYWTIKESVIKADSRGLSIPLSDLHVKNNTVVYDNHTWYLNQLNIDKDYSACLATNKQNVVISLKYIDFYMENGKRRMDADDCKKKVEILQL